MGLFHHALIACPFNQLQKVKLYCCLPTILTPIAKLAELKYNWNTDWIPGKISCLSHLHFLTVFNFIYFCTFKHFFALYSFWLSYIL